MGQRIGLVEVVIQHLDHLIVVVDTEALLLLLKVLEWIESEPAVRLSHHLDLFVYYFLT